MKKTRYTENQIIQILKEAETGKQTADICREYGISSATFYSWKAKYGGMEGSEIKRLRELEDENRRLKKMFAELSLDHQILKEILEKKG
jgi:putative transposase